MKIGDLIKVVPSHRLDGYAPAYVRRHYGEVGIIVDTKVLGGNTVWFTLIGEKIYQIPEWNVRLLSHDKT